MAYSVQEWRDGDPVTPLSAARLRHIEAGIEAAHATVAALELRVADLEDAATA